MTDVGFEPNGDAGPFHGFAFMSNGVPRWTGRVELLRERLDEPLRATKPRRIFVNSMSDTFHPSVPFEDVARVFAVMAAARRHRFLVLTKRPRRARAFYAWLRGEMVRSYAPAAAPDGIDTNALFGPNWERLDGCPKLVGKVGELAGMGGDDFPQSIPLPNVAIGVSVEDQGTADERIPELLATPAATRFISYEPALDAVDFVPWLFVPDPRGAPADLIPRRGNFKPAIDWIIVGGESGPRARPFDVEWARSTVAQCNAAAVPCFVKQLGAVPCEGFDTTRRAVIARNLSTGDACELVEVERLIRLKDRKGGDPSEWPEDIRVRELPDAFR